MQKITLFLILTCVFASCNPKKEKENTKHYLLETPIPKDILKMYLTKINLSNIESGVDSFEIRKWYPFYYTDSFPVAMERIYFFNGALKAECFLFSDSSGGLITSKEEMSHLKAEKYIFKNLPMDLLDSFKLTYSLQKIDTFDTGIIKRKKATGFTTATTRHMLFEQATKNAYYCAFISDPKYFTDLHPSINKYEAFSDFVQKILIQNDSEFEKWLATKGEVIISQQ